MLMYRWSFIAIIVLLFSCSDGKSKPDVSGIEVDVTLQRFEQDFFKIDSNNVVQGLAALQKKYPQFYPIYMQDILQLPPTGAEALTVIKTIISSYRSLNDSIQKKYPDMDWLQKDLEQNFKYVKYYFPNYKVPNIITFIATLDAPGAVLTPQHLGIGLHQYAGKHFGAYQSAEVQQLYPSYISRRFDKEYMVANSLRAIADDVHPDQSVGRPLIEQMVEKGKQWYLLNHIAPDAADSAITGYTTAQLEWADNNEGNIWGHVIKTENLYSIEPHVIQTYIGEAPFTQGMPQQSPGNLGQWIGWRIVQQFAQKNGAMTLQQILQTPAKTIFEGAQYRPK
ncbi:MAG: hypothetical protein ACO1NX_02580 [Chitinophagaceae bacterium]